MEDVYTQPPSLSYLLAGLPLHFHRQTLAYPFCVSFLHVIKNQLILIWSISCESPESLALIESLHSSFFKEQL